MAFLTHTIKDGWMTFTQLLALVQAERLTVTADSRQVQAGGVFVAVAGTQVDGHDYVGQALSCGAKYIVTERAVEGVDCIITADSAGALGLLAQASFGNPCMSLRNLAVTGTNGKTTVAYMVRSVLEYTGARCGLIGTIEYSTGGSKRAAQPCVEPAAFGGDFVYGGGVYQSDGGSFGLSQDGG